MKYRCIYAVEFPDNSVYVGLSYNFKIRTQQHLSQNNSTVYKKIKQDNLTPIFKKLTDYIDENLAVLKEKEYVEYYNNSKWHILNIVKTGGLGGSTIKWTLNECHKIALKYKNRKDFWKEVVMKVPEKINF